MQCPHGRHDLRIPSNVELNMVHYHNQCLTLTECCGKPVITIPFEGYRAERYTGTRDEDDWGQPIPQPRVEWPIGR